MKRYEVIKFFTDLQDNKHAYIVGSMYPRKGVDVSQSRIKELSTNDNRQGTPLIKLVEDDSKSDDIEKSNSELDSKDEPKPTKKSRRTPRRKRTTKE